jgi:ferredoxin
MRRTARAVDARRLIVDPIACDGVGLCAQLAPGLVDLDRWGYPVVPAGDVTASSDRRAAKRAVRGCPHNALALMSAAARR